MIASIFFCLKQPWVSSKEDDPHSSSVIYWAASRFSEPIEWPNFRWLTSSSLKGHIFYLAQLPSSGWWEPFFRRFFFWVFWKGSFPFFPRNPQKRSTFRLSVLFFFDFLPWLSSFLPRRPTTLSFVNPIHTARQNFHLIAGRQHGDKVGRRWGHTYLGSLRDGMYCTTR